MRFIVSGRFVTLLLLAGILITAALSLVSVNRHAAEIRRLKTALAAHSVEQRIGEALVVDQRVDKVTGMTETTLYWREKRLDKDRYTEPCMVRVKGRQVYVEALVITFTSRPAEEQDPLTGRSLTLFRRIFGENEAPAAGFHLGNGADPVPDAYRLDAMPSDVERDLWTNFWTIATDPIEAEKRGVTRAHAKAPSTIMAPGKMYRFAASGGGHLDVEGPLDPPASGPGAWTP